MNIFKFALATLALVPSMALAAALPERPPQYVLLAFDGSLNLDFWQESYDFAHTNDLKFTYFISGPYFLMYQHKSEYTEPTHGAGRSAIGWGGSDPHKISQRVDWVNRAYDDGNEIGSHANGHYDGSKWTLENWRSEFKQFYHLIFDVLRINGISSSAENPFHFKPEEIKGFRAPLLGQNPSMYQALHDYNYAYDTSKTAPTNYWPQKLNGIWNFPLAEVRIAGTGKRTLSMDYNFYYTQSNGQPKPENYAEYKKEMLETYLHYFASNYVGNRAPVNIGHHFSKWNGGAYWDAMKEFAQTVCTLPEVKCVTYREYTKYMESLSPAVVAQYRLGKFDRSNMPSDPAVTLAAKDRTVHADVAMTAARADAAPVAASAASAASAAMVGAPPMSLANAMSRVTAQNKLSANLSGEQAQALLKSPKTRFLWTVDGKFLADSSRPSIDMSELSRYIANGSKIQVAVRYNGRELLTATHTVTKADGEKLDLGKQLSAQAREDYALTPDPVEAHAHEEEEN